MFSGTVTVLGEPRMLHSDPPAHDRLAEVTKKTKPKPPIFNPSSTELCRAFLQENRNMKDCAETNLVPRMGSEK